MSTTCGLATDSLSYCWGFRPNLGYPDDAGLSYAVPVPTPEGGHYRLLAAASDKVCGLTNDSLAFCWGRSPGDGTDRDSVPHLVGSNLRFRSLRGGGGVICGLTADSTAYCWGLNEYGQVGNGIISPVQPTPSLVAGGALHFRTIAIGGLHACGIASDHLTYCWGNNTFKQLGVSDTLEPCGPGGQPDCALTPQRLSDTIAFTTI
ncbi:MAG: RCC1 domain-containing protein, partial [Gemmatimonadota bacterium]